MSERSERTISIVGEAPCAEPFFIGADSGEHTCSGARTLAVHR